MPHLTTPSLPTACLIILLLLTSYGSTSTKHSSTHQLEINSPWLRDNAPGAPIAGFLTIHNHSKHEDKLIAIQGELAQRIELHQTTSQNGITSMREITKGIPIAANSSLKLQPKGYHIMLFALTKELKHNQTYTLELVLEKAGTIPVEFKVIAGNKTSHNHHH